MKTKLIILTAVATALLYSCSGDRDENISPAPEKTKLENLKLNNQTTDVNLDHSTKSDSIIIKNGDELPVGDNINPNDSEIVNPGDVKPPKGG